MRRISGLREALMSSGLPWPRVQIRVQLLADRSIATASRGGAAIWSAEGPGTTELGGCPEAMKAVLSNIPRARRLQPRAALVVEVGSDSVQVKRLFGLPAAADPFAASLILRENATRFFRATSTRLMTSAVRDRPDGSRWAAAYRGEVVSEITLACERAGVTLLAIIPHAGLTEALGSGEGLGLCAPLGGQGTLTLPPRERRLLAGAGLLGIALLALVPLAVARVTARADLLAHAELDARERVALKTAEELRHVSQALSELDVHRAAGRSMIDLLGAITLALPQGAAMLQLRVDTTGGSIVVLANGTDAVLAGLQSGVGLDGLEIVGPVVKERVGDRSLDRLHLKFRHAASATVRSAR